MAIFNMTGGGGSGGVKTKTYTERGSTSTSISFSDVSTIPKAYWMVMTDTNGYNTRNNGVCSVSCGDSSGEPIFTYIDNSLFVTNTGSSSSVYISNNNLIFSTSGINYWLYFPRGIWTLYYIE